MTDNELHFRVTVPLRVEQRLPVPAFTQKCRGCQGPVRGTDQYDDPDPAARVMLPGTTLAGYVHDRPPCLEAFGRQGIGWTVEPDEVGRRRVVGVTDVLAEVRRLAGTGRLVVTRAPGGTAARPRYVVEATP
jgi:hypothetical protein